MAFRFTAIAPAILVSVALYSGLPNKAKTKEYVLQSLHAVRPNDSFKIVGSGKKLHLIAEMTLIDENEKLIYRDLIPLNGKVEFAVNNSDFADGLKYTLAGYDRNKVVISTLIRYRKSESGEWVKSEEKPIEGYSGVTVVVASNDKVWLEKISRAINHLIKLECPEVSDSF